MTDAELLTKIKNGLGITGEFQDDTLSVYIDDVKEFLKSAGVEQSVIESNASVGCIMRGVADLWNYGSGNATLSDYFKMRVVQLRQIKTETHGKVKKIAPYLFKTKYDILDYDAGSAYFEKYRPTIGGCSAVSSGNLFGRNYDWTYDERCSFVVETSAKETRHATLGVAFAPAEITQEFIESGKDSELFKLIPFMLLDGINDAGLICEINVVPTGDKGLTFGSNPDGEDLFAMMIPRYVLDYAASVDDAIALLENRNIFCAYSEAMKQEFHFMLSDGTKTAVVEFIDNEMTVIENFVDNKPILTNLYLSGYDGTRESLTPYAMGIERQSILSSGYENATSENAMIDLMRSVWYTKTYSPDENPLWYSEYAGNWEKWGNLTKDSAHEAYSGIMQHYFGEFTRRKRNGVTWQTVHTSIYNIEKRKLIVIPQESGYRFNFSLSVSEV